MKKIFSISLVLLIFFQFVCFADKEPTKNDTCNCVKVDPKSLGWICTGGSVKDEFGNSISNFTVIKQQFSSDTYIGEKSYVEQSSEFGNSGSSGDWDIVVLRKSGYQDLLLDCCLDGAKILKNKKIGRDGNHYYYDNGDIYIGNFNTDSYRNGYGIYFWSNGGFWKGKWINDKMDEGSYFKDNRVIEKWQSGIAVWKIADKKYESWEVLSFQNNNDVKMTLKRSVNYSDYRVNPDGSKFYKTNLALCSQNKGVERYAELPDYFYSSDDKKGFTTPCIIIDPKMNTLCIFVLEKDNNAGNYGMTGYAYFYSDNTKNFRKETIFTHANWGWYSFFGGSDNGNPKLCHFGFAGYVALESKRNSDGTWTNYEVGGIEPAGAANQYSNHKNFLVTNAPDVDKMTGVGAVRYARTTNYAPSYSNSGYTLGTDEVLVLGFAGIFFVGKALLGILPSGGSSSNYSSGSSSSSSSVNVKNDIENQNKAKEIKECISEFEKELKINPSYSSDNCQAWSTSTGNLGGWDFSYIIEDKFMKEKGWYIHHDGLPDDGPFYTKLEVIKKYCEYKYQ